MRAVKYFAAFCVIYLAVVWLSVSTMNGYEQSVWDYVWATLQTTRGQLLVVAGVGYGG